MALSAAGQAPDGAEAPGDAATGQAGQAGEAAPAGEGVRQRVERLHERVAETAARVRAEAA